MEIGNITELVAKLSTDFEQANTPLKRKYILTNIYTYNLISSLIEESEGTFGTGYPYYVLSENLQGNLPKIEEQIRYNNDLVKVAQKFKDNEWICKNCLKHNYDHMPDLKIICKPCPKIDNAIKPRKIINRLPDMDMWTIAKDNQAGEVISKLTKLLKASEISTSDINPKQTIFDFMDISKDIKNGKLPTKYLPIDTHVVELSKLTELIKQVPSTIEQAKKEGKNPKLDILPLSYRKTWQYDDEPYNFIFDFLFSFNIFTKNKELLKVISDSRYEIAQQNTPEQLIQLAYQLGADSTKRRMQTPELVANLREKFEAWQDKEKIKQVIEKDEIEI